VTPFDLENDKMHWPADIKASIPALCGLRENEIPLAESQLEEEALA
jgi:hypothetical protein